MTDLLRSLDIPEVLARKNIEHFLSQSLLGEAKKTREIICRIIETLRSDDVRKDILSGKLTLAMIKPRLHEALGPGASFLYGLTDSDIAHFIEKQIDDPLSIVLSVSLIFDRNMAEAWYEGKPMQSQTAIPPFNPNRYGKHHQTRWDEFIALMEGGPATFLLLSSPDGKAVEHWRQQMGNDWNIPRIKVTQPDSLRARFARDNHNNLLHGSDSPSSVQREVELLASFLERLVPQRER